MNPSTIKVLVSVLLLLQFAGSLWHGDAHATLDASLSRLQTIFVVVVVLLAPIAGAALTWTRYFIAGNWVVGVSMVGSVLFGVYNNYAPISPDNVEHLPPGPSRETNPVGRTGWRLPACSPRPFRP